MKDPDTNLKSDVVITKDDKSLYRLNESLKLKQAIQDAQDSYVYCRSSTLKRVRKRLIEIKTTCNRKTNIYKAICATLVGIAIKSLFNVVVKDEPLAAIAYTAIFLISGFIWYLLERAPTVQVGERIDDILEDLPDPDKAIPLGEKSES